jgi:hypothetical protein
MKRLKFIILKNVGSNKQHRVITKSAKHCMDTQNYWVLGLCPPSGILETRKHYVSEIGSVTMCRWGGKTPSHLGPIEKLTSISFWDTGRWTKSKNSVLLSVIHHRQNRLEYNYMVTWKISFIACYDLPPFFLHFYMRNIRVVESKMKKNNWYADVGELSAGTCSLYIIWRTHMLRSSRLYWLSLEKYWVASLTVFLEGFLGKCLLNFRASEPDCKQGRQRGNPRDKGEPSSEL